MCTQVPSSVIHSSRKMATAQVPTHGACGLSTRCPMILLRKGMGATYSSLICFYPNVAFVIKVYLSPEGIWLGLAFKMESDNLPFRRTVCLHLMHD